MAISFGPGDGGEDEMMATINTTPLVDVMLVLLIIFLITIPVATHTVPVSLPREANQPTQTRPGNITVAVDHHGRIYWNEEAVADQAALARRMAEVAVLSPQPELHIRGDEEALYEAVGQVVAASQQAGLVKLSFITQPAARGN